MIPMPQIFAPLPVSRLVTSAAFALLAAGPVGAQQVPDLAPYLMADQAIEVELARTAAPSQVSDSATVLVLTRSGYAEAARGANGFTCVVLRSFSGRIGDPDFWNPRVRAPHCFNPPAARTVLPAMLRRAEWILGGVSPGEITARTRRGYDSGEFSMPAAGAMAYMLSHRQHLLDADPQWMPHLMFYYDKSMPAAAWGAGGMTAPVIDGSAGETDVPVLTLLIPVRQWSDGTPALPGGHPGN
jgi:hypothetical protein